MTIDYEAKTDEELVAMYRSGEKDVEDVLIRRFHPLVEQEASSLFLTGGDREDLVQEGNVGLYQAILSFAPERNARFSTFAGLCIRRAQYKAIEAGNRKKHNPLNLSISIDAGEAADSDHVFSITEIRAEDERFNPESVMLSEERKRELERDLAEELSPLERKVLYFYLNGEEYGSIAGRLGKPKKSIDNALQRIRRKVRKLCLKDS
ncbi:MAG: sigma-70 family RNA polymerase sigma factor [Lachnospiraceae bacterium]|nr:sigma-70 family RNA polymerase sigma factor [Lachnospiraceae bacterium]